MPSHGYTAGAASSGMFGQLARSTCNFTDPIPVHITYQTAFVDEAGKLQFREDIYGRDATLLAALKGDRPRRPTIPVARARAELTAARRCGCRPASRRRNGGAARPVVLRPAVR